MIIIAYLEDMRGEADIAVHGVEGVHLLEVSQELDQLHLHAREYAQHHLPHLLCHLKWESSSLIGRLGPKLMWCSFIGRYCVNARLK